ncbi:DUF2793 domain-containing protein [Marimonas lutisalis]|uniref:DUF2793 domain-containing protein n=1 Tax=Marimonas lutisalis TaxID=2545756 RepID=UPI0010F8B495|nr:DUF2793 domain-containing protein [Marimonas lutisalis]
MTDTSPAFGLPYIMPSQAQKHVTRNEALRLLDAVVQLSVETPPATTPPAIAETGQRYVIASGATGEWAGHDNEIAVRDGDAWFFVAPKSGWRADVVVTGDQLRFDGSAWSSTAPLLQHLPELGVNTTADSMNRLAVASPATLLTNEGAGHQLKVNKAAATDTASLLFETGWSGRAEMGTTGSDDFAIKVSMDGTTWREALTIDADNGALRTPSGQTYFNDVFILDDSAYAFEIPWSNPARILMWLAVNITGHHFLFSITGSMGGAQNFAEMFMNPPGKLNFYNGPLTGTTGTDGAVNLSIENDNGIRRMYIENRLGTNRLFTMATLGK